VKPNRPPSKPAPAQKIDQLLTPNRPRFSTLRKLLAEAQAHDAWTSELRVLLPASIAGDCQALSLTDGVLVVGCTNAAVATRLRFITADLLADLRCLSHFSGLRELRIRITTA